ncbi:MAG: hypothetical protein JWM12_3512 [Ilumatobacteraceae bacterium]|nr:hypothetical protein [Ilumatobacteraceae bacterium]
MATRGHTMVRHWHVVACPATLTCVDEIRPLAIVDIDGVVADVRHRLHFLERGRKDWPAFFAAAVDDPAHPEGLAVVETLRAGHEIVFLTGRPEHLRAATVGWLEAHGLDGPRLVMRHAGDRRPAAQIKLEEIDSLARGGSIGIVVDDDDRVLAAVRAAGYPVFAAEWERRSSEEDAVLSTAQERDGVT